MKTLGVDIGRVIIHGDGFLCGLGAQLRAGGSDDDAMAAPAMDGAIESLFRLTNLFGPSRVWIVSKCGPRIQQRSRLWLARHRFFERTGIPREHLRFCRERNEKAPICLELGVDVFVDDRLDVLVPMAGIVEHRFLFGASSSPDRGVVAVPTWAHAEAAITPIALHPGAGTPAARAR